VLKNGFISILLLKFVKECITVPAKFAIFSELFRERRKRI